MSEEKKCCECCENKELNNEQLDKVSGGDFYQTCTEQNGKFICSHRTCNLNKTVDGIANVCTCSMRRKTAICKFCGE